MHWLCVVWIPVRRRTKSTAAMIYYGGNIFLVNCTRNRSESAWIHIPLDIIHAMSGTELKMRKGNLFDSQRFTVNSLESSPRMGWKRYSVYMCARTSGEMWMCVHSLRDLWARHWDWTVQTMASGTYCSLIMIQKYSHIVVHWMPFKSYRSAFKITTIEGVVLPYIYLVR